MSSRLLGPAWDADVPPMQKLVLLKLVDCANDDGSSCWPSVATIVGDTGASRRFVQRTLRLFEGDGLLEVVTLGGMRGNKSTEYQINLGILASYVGASPRRGRPGDAGVPDDAEGRPPDAQPLIDPSEKEKRRLRRILDNEDLRKWVTDHRPDLGFEELAEAWDDTWTGKGIVPGVEQEAALFKGYARKAPKQKTRKAPKKDTRPIEPRLIDGLDAEATKAWQECHRRIVQRHGTDAWRTWLAPCTYGEITEGAAVIAASSAFARDHVKNDFGIAIERELTKALGRPIHIEFSTQQKAAAE